MKEILTPICFDLDDTLVGTACAFSTYTIQSASPSGTGEAAGYYKAFAAVVMKCFSASEQGDFFECMHIKRIQLALKDHGILINDEEAMDFKPPIKGVSMRLHWRYASGKYWIIVVL